MNELVIERLRRLPLGAATPVVLLALGLLGALLVTPVVMAADRVVNGVSEQFSDIPPLPEHFERPAERSTVHAADGSLLAVLWEENRVIVRLEEVPVHARQAVIATEDVRFFEHDGVDLRGAVRAFVSNFQAGRVVEGGSTITQQYVKNVVLTSEVSAERKIAEALYAVQLERRRTKHEILEGYVNVAYFGNGVYGIATAAQFYFGKSVGDVTLGEAALLAGVLANPGRFDPIANPDRADMRRRVVLERMVAAGFASREEADAAAAEPIEVEPRPNPEPHHPFFVEFVKQQLLADPALGETREDRVRALFAGGLRIVTTLDPVIQDRAESAIAGHLEDPLDDPLGALVSIDPRTGAIPALATGPRAFGVCPPDEADGCIQTKLNPVVRGMGGSGRQPGSAFKPILLAAALEGGIPTSWHARTQPGQTIPDCGAPGEPWQPRNYSDGSSGTMDMVGAIRVSNNVYHALLIAEIGPAAVVELASRMGFGEDVPEVCAIALGAAEVFPIEMASAFGIFANDGIWCEPFAVARVLAPDGSTVVEREPTCERVIEERTARLMNNMLRGVITSGTARSAQIGRDAAGKTGTTDDHRDAWFVGYVPQLVTAAWVGYEVPREMTGILGYARITGGSVPARMWADYMSAALEGVEVEPLLTERLDRYTPPRRQVWPDPWDDRRRRARGQGDR